MPRAQCHRPLDLGLTTSRLRLRPVAAIAAASKIRCAWSGAAAVRSRRHRAGSARFHRGRCAPATPTRPSTSGRPPTARRPVGLLGVHRQMLGTAVPQGPRAPAGWCAGERASRALAAAPGPAHRRRRGCPPHPLRPLTPRKHRPRQRVIPDRHSPPTATACSVAANCWRGSAQTLARRLQIRQRLAQQRLRLRERLQIGVVALSEVVIAQVHGSGACPLLIRVLYHILARTSRCVA